MRPVPTCGDTSPVRGQLPNRVQQDPRRGQQEPPLPALPVGSSDPATAGHRGCLGPSFPPAESRSLPAIISKDKPLSSSREKSTAVNDTIEFGAQLSPEAEKNQNDLINKRGWFEDTLIATKGPRLQQLPYGTM